jgi:tripartite motif-containing protein 71
MSRVFTLFALPLSLTLLLLVGQKTPAADIARQPKLLLAWGENGSEPGQFRSPIGIAISPKDEIYVTDVNNARVQKFTADGRYLSGFDLVWDKPDRRMAMAGGIAVDAEGVYVSLMQRDKVALYRDDGGLVREFGKHGSGEGELNGPGGIVLAPDRTLYVADQQNHRVQRFTVDGKFLGAWGQYGSGPGQFGGREPAGSRFGGPHFLARDSHGRIYTTEGALGRVQQFTPEGRFLAAWGDKGDQPGGFGAHPRRRGEGLGPIGVAVDGRDHVLISSLNDRVQIFTADGKYLLGFGGTGDGPGEFRRPHGLAFNSRGYLYVADAGNHRIQKFEMPDVR